MPLTSQSRFRVTHYIKVSKKTETPTTVIVTFVEGCEAEDVKVVLLLLPQAVVPNARHCVLASTWLSGDIDGILDRAIAQPAGVAPVQLALPCLVQLVEGCHNGVLVPTCSLSIVEVEVVASQAGEVGEHDTYEMRKGVTFFCTF